MLTLMAIILTVGALGVNVYDTLTRGKNKNAIWASVTCLAGAMLCVLALQYTQPRSIVNEHLPVGLVFTTQGQALVTKEHFLISDNYGKIYDLSNIKFASQDVYSDLLLGGHRTYIIDQRNNGFYIRECR